MKYFIVCFFFVLALYSRANTYTVTNTNDAGAGSLRQAITNANTSTGVADLINFSVTGTIALASNLPALTDNAGVTIDGTSAPGYVANTNSKGSYNGSVVIQIDGTGLTRGFTISSSNVIIKGLNIANVGGAGGTDYAIEITAGSGSQILGCYIGTNLAGTSSSGTNTERGIFLNNVSGNYIGDGTAAGRNLISGIKAAGFGLYLDGAFCSGNGVRGNIIGLQKDGATLMNVKQAYGIYITNSALGNTIGGITRSEGNIISGNSSYGITVNTTISGGNTIKGNIIGPQADGVSYVSANVQIGRAHV